MTPERLAEIRDRFSGRSQPGFVEARSICGELLAEVDRLNAVFTLAGDERTDLAAELLRMRTPTSFTLGCCGMPLAEGHGPGCYMSQPQWINLFGIDPDFTEGVPVDEWLDRERGEA